MTPIATQSYVQAPVAASTVAEIAVRSVAGATVSANAVASSPSAHNVITNRQNQPHYAEKSRISAEGAAFAQNTNTSSVDTLAPLPAYNSSFLAQLLAQSDTLSSDIAVYFSETPSVETTLNTELMTQFSEVKYMPSYAAKPRPEAPQVAPPPAVEQPRQRVDSFAADIPEQPAIEEPSSAPDISTARYAPAPDAEQTMSLIS